MNKTEMVQLQAKEEFLRRLYLHPDGEMLVLRGSTMTRLWVQPYVRPADDIDFIARFESVPVADTDQRAALKECVSELLIEALDWHGGVNGVHFYSHVILDDTWEYTNYPGLRGKVEAIIRDLEVDFQIDIAFGDPLIPEPTWQDYPSFVPGHTESVRVYAVPPELGLAWKIHGLFEFDSWRPKDLHDVYLMFLLTPLDWSDLARATRIAFTSRGYDLKQAEAAMSKRFADTETHRLAWASFRNNRQDPEIPSSLKIVEKFVMERLQRLFASPEIFETIAYIPQ